MYSKDLTPMDVSVLQALWQWIASPPQRNPNPNYVRDVLACR
jgi:hypothetical protein